MNFCKVKKVNLEVKSLEKLLKQNDLTIADILKDDGMLKMIEKTYGIDLSKIAMETNKDVYLDLDKIIAYSDVENILGFDDFKAFPIWFDYDNSHCWYLYPEYFDLINSYLQNKTQSYKPLNS